MNITYRQFAAYLQQEDYTPEEINHLFHVILQMKKSSRSWVLQWIQHGILPTEEVEGITAAFLIDECHFKVLNALIILDWLKTDPAAAKHFLTTLPSTIPPSENVQREVAELMPEAVSNREPSHEHDEITDLPDTHENSLS